MELLKQQLLLQMECPICYKYMSPPIRMCSKGHSTCDLCTQKHQTCVKCQYPFLTTRNLALEALTFQLSIECNNCKKYFTSDILHDHNCTDFVEEEEEFEDDVYLCHITKLDKNYNKKICRWTGFINDVKEHFLSEHLTNYFVLDDGQLFKWVLPYAQDQENISVVVMDNNSFLQEVFYEHKSKILYFSVYHINNKNKRFIFKISIPKKNKKEFCGEALNKYENIQKIRKGILEIDVDVFDMRKDREIIWNLSVTKL